MMEHGDLWSHQNKVYINWTWHNTRNGHKHSNKTISANFHGKFNTSKLELLRCCNLCKGREIMALIEFYE